MASALAPAARQWRQRLVDEASIEVTVRDKDAASVLQGRLPAGARVHVTHLASATYLETVAQARALAAAGFEPVPHIAARSLRSETELDDYLARLTGEAGGKRVLLVAGDLDPPCGPYPASLDLLATGLFEARGVREVGFAIHPEGHPRMPAAVMRRALADKLAYAAEHGLEAELISQFCFEAAPILSCIRALRADGIVTPVKIGAAAPTDALRMMRFALRCGVGPSLRTLERNAARFSGVIAAAGPEGLVDELALALAAEDVGAIGGMHFFVFGGAVQAADWLRRWRGGLLGA